MSKETLNAFIGTWLPQIEDEMRAVLQSDEAELAAHYGMMHYHMGWADEQFRPYHHPSGKRLRPILCLLACAEVGGDPADALPAAAAIEILHNFSLVHDDIEDGDETRRHRPTVWKIWGEPQAINVGDGMYALSFAAIQRLTRRGIAAKTTLTALDIFTKCCVALTEGQHLDMHFEGRSQVSVGEYLRMIQGKTAALTAASVAIGALLGGADDTRWHALSQFGESLGLAFQIQDDILGIWGDPAITGKAAGNDILKQKKSLPLLHALNHEKVGVDLQNLFRQKITEEDLPTALAYLTAAETRPFVEEQLQFQHDRGISALHQALNGRAERSALKAMADNLLYRSS